MTITGRCAGSASLVLLLSATAQAATIRGSVSDVTGGMVPGAHGDVLAATVAIVTNEPFSADRRWIYRFNGGYSTNKQGRRGTATLGATTPLA